MRATRQTFGGLVGFTVPRGSELLDLRVAELDTESTQTWVTTPTEQVLHVVNAAADRHISEPAGERFRLRSQLTWVLVETPCDVTCESIGSEGSEVTHRFAGRELESPRGGRPSRRGLNRAHLGQPGRADRESQGAAGTDRSSSASMIMAALFDRCGTRRRTRIGSVSASRFRDSQSARKRRASFRAPPSPAKSRTGPGASTSNVPSQGVPLATDTARSDIAHVFPPLYLVANMP